VVNFIRQGNRIKQFCISRLAPIQYPE
jgi:hypothetical protein